LSTLNPGADFGCAGAHAKGNLVAFYPVLDRQRREAGPER
jgi:hypothetical protein